MIWLRHWPARVCITGLHRYCRDIILSMYTSYQQVMQYHKTERCEEMGMKLVHSHNTVIELYDKHLQAPGWPEDPAVEQAVLLIKPAAGRMIKKSILSAWVEVTPTGKKRKLHDIESDDDSGVPSLHGVSSEVGDGTLLVTGLDDLKHLHSHFSP
ncbi:hypothetical protein DEU56DRAFT_755174 [Suillus clintonianus]|uniref:uncharacterized protein n=1 Tax=Suillus clintonianus TaxID=1904413 RepID=UPI001B870778|nr:uncharacterized protein DEU56DRAFT_755174 [Suillus clintonianus]KAG2140557.1 hypothetical protein DEU56DRAFT_755174 [Suillus clintonianus]